MENRLISLNGVNEYKGQSVIYFVSRDIRVKDNFALIAAQQKAISLKQPLVVCFVLDVSITSRSQEHFLFMVNGLEEFASSLNKLNISFILRSGHRYDEYLKVINELNPSAIYFDFSPLRKPRQIQKKIALHSQTPVSVVDTHNIIPLWQLSAKEEFAAYTIRHKVVKNLDKYLIEPENVAFHEFTYTGKLYSLPFKEAKDQIKQTPGCGLKISFDPGEAAAMNQLRRAIEQIGNYAINRNDPNKNAQANLSPYLHFGFIASLRVVLELMKIMEQPPLLTREAKLVTVGNPVSLDDNCNALIEEIVVRKELADNFCFYNKNYNNFKAARQWAADTLKKANNDPREKIYSIEELEQGLTADPAWNAAQNQMKITGKMHGYMRMYWAKKILEWSVSAKEAVRTAVYLNDKYSIDGGDPNGYAGIAWSILGIHDRPWFDRPIFGKIRYMNYQGLKKKFDIEAYESKWI